MRPLLAHRSITFISFNGQRTTYRRPLSVATGTRPVPGNVVRIRHENCFESIASPRGESLFREGILSGVPFERGINKLYCKTSLSTVLKGSENVLKPALTCIYFCRSKNHVLCLRRYLRSPASFNPFNDSTYHALSLRRLADYRKHEESSSSIDTEFRRG